MRRVILNFHGLGTPKRDLETGEAAYWVHPDMFRAALDLAEQHKARTETHFTFDDSNASDLEIAAPMLSETGRLATFFVLSERIDQPGSLSTANIRALQAAGHRIGSHGARHVDWKALDSAAQIREYDTARMAIADVTGQPVTEAAIPFGRYNRSVLQALGARGYTRIYSSDGGAWTRDTAPIPRTSPRAEMRAADIEAILLGREPALKSIRRRLSRAVKRRL